MKTKEKSFDSLLLKNQLCFPIYLCSKEIINSYSDLLEALDLTYTQYVVMMYFWEKSESNVKELGNTLLLDSSTLTPLLKKLEAKGFIERKRSSLDERNVIVSLTEKGTSLKEKALFVPHEMSKRFNLTEKEATTLYKLVYKVLLNIEREKEND